MERAQRTHTEEFYEVADLEWTVESVNGQLRRPGQDPAAAPAGLRGGGEKRAFVVPTL